KIASLARRSLRVCSLLVVLAVPIPYLWSGLPTMLTCLPSIITYFFILIDAFHQRRPGSNYTLTEHQRQLHWLVLRHWPRGHLQ
ncbi:MAG: hypothetical protein ACK56F_30070, partial [bacterium]